MAKRSQFYVNPNDKEVETLELKLFKNEYMINRIESVVKYNNWGSRFSTHGELGTLYLTNFRLSFVTPMSYDANGETEDGKDGVHKLVGVRDIPLPRITAIYSETPDKAKLKQLRARTFKHTPSSIHIHTKDFGISTFHFEKVSKPEIKKFVHHVMMHICPKKYDLLYAYSYEQPELMNGDDGKSQCAAWKPRTYMERMHWEDELKRYGANSQWRVTQCNEHLKVSDSMCECFPVPNCFNEQDLHAAAPQFTENKLPVWCYCHKYGNSLVMFPTLRSDTYFTSVETSYIESIRKTLPDNSKGVLKEYNMETKICTVTDLQSSYYDLHKICAGGSPEEFYATDNSYLSHLESSKWLHYVKSALGLARTVALDMENNKNAILLKEEGGADLACVVSSLVILLLDEKSRTISGLQNIIQKCWVSSGHRFCDRLGLIMPDPHTTSIPQMSPVMLLFLDCVYQLTLQFPSVFEFGEFYLLSLWDSCTMGLFKEFICNNNKQRNPSAGGQIFKDRNTGANASSAAPNQKNSSPSVWDWNIQYHSDFIALFRNPLYELAEHQHDETSRHLDITQLHVLIADIEFWYGCYFRNNPPLQIINGGKPAEYLQQCVIMQEISELEKRIARLKQSSSVNRSSGLLLSGGEKNFQELRDKFKSSYLTSTYPFNNQITRNMSELSLCELLDRSVVLTSDEALAEMDDP